MEVFTQGKSNGDETIHQERVGSIVSAVSQQYQDVAEEEESSVLVHALPSIYSCMNSGLSGSLRACASLGTASER